MPTYVYRCPSCGDREITHSIHDPAIATCLECGTDWRRVIGNPAVTFQGGREFFRETTIKTELEQTMRSVRASGGTPEVVGKRWT